MVTEKTATSAKRKVAKALGVSYLRSVARNIRGTRTLRSGQRSYSQCGEDLLVNFIFGAIRQSAVSYLDVGAHHPTFLSNTYLFYKAGGSGVCVEPDPRLCSAI